ncbi:uncharacterized protein LOC118184414 [Stegodyphus dumicola]|uniref:uncharacterized protein LOC118184414 n=1 Tax=Stegodyphus dumicola TaxID=202533 RepID=UPI0015B37D5F|nr:uncharacterized protein LOC118184414 [Stegodyphus dumicola]
MQMEDFINAHNLLLHNTPEDPPTFVTINGKGWHDLTLSSHHLINRINNRRICEDESISDHQIITFDIVFEVPHTQTLRYRINRNAEKKFAKALNSKAHIILHEIQSINSKDEVNAYATTLTKHIQEISHTSLKIKTVNHNTKPNWWTKELRAERQKTKALRRKMKRRTTDEERKAAWIDFNKQRAIYKKKLIEAKLKSWTTYCTKNQTTYGALYKMTTSKIYKPTQIHATTNTSQSNGTDLTSTTINGILDQVFLKDDSAEDKPEQKELRASTQTPSTPDDIPFTRKKYFK